MDDYQIALRKWAAAKLGLDDWRTVAAVHLEGDTGSPGYSTWTPGEPPTFAISASVLTGGVSRANKPLTDLRVVTDLDDKRVPFDELLGEILRVEITPEDRTQ